VSFFRKVFAFLSIIGYLVAFDILGVIACLVFDSLPLRGVSTALFYTVWFVGGVFCGLLGYNTAGGLLLKVEEGDWTASPASGKAGLTIIVVMAVILAGLWVLFQKVMWKSNMADDPYVPDNLAMTATFFVSILLSMILGHAFLRPKPPKG